jgi:hypothetical protein
MTKYQHLGLDGYQKNGHIIIGHSHSWIAMNPKIQESMLVYNHGFQNFVQKPKPRT